MGRVPPKFFRNTAARSRLFWEQAVRIASQVTTWSDHRRAGINDEPLDVTAPDPRFQWTEFLKARHNMIHYLAEIEKQSDLEIAEAFSCDPYQVRLIRETPLPDCDGDL